MGLRPTNCDEHRSETAETGADLTEAVIGAAFEFAKVLGAGFLEKIYERDLTRELLLRGLGVRTQVSFPICYKG